MNIIDLAPGNAWESGADGYIFKYGQGQLEYNWKPLAQHAIDEGKPYGGYWVCDARYSPESHKAAIKAAFPTGAFGTLGLWLDVEKPYASITDAQYRALPYAFYKPVESIWRGVQLYTGKWPGWYFSPGSWDLILSAMPLTLQEEVATKALEWIAHYTSAAAPLQRGKWTKWTMWQWREQPDYNRYDVEWFERVTGAVEPPPPPVVNTIVVKVQSDAQVKLQSVLLNGADETAHSSIVISPLTPPAPPPPPAPVINPYRVLWMFERPANLAPEVRFNKPDVLPGRAPSRVPLTSELQHYWYALLLRNRPAGWTDDQMKKAWKSLTAGDRAFTNFAGSEDHHDYINNTNVTAPDIAMDKFRVCGGGIVNVLSETPVNIIGIPCYRVQAIDPASHPDPTKINHGLTPWLVHVATNDYELPQIHVGGFPQLGGNPVQVPLLGVGGENLIPVACLQKLDPTKPYPSPYLTV